MKKIPVARSKCKLGNITYDHNWIDYEEDKVFIIKLDKKGNIGDYQYDGTSCRQSSVRGFVYKEFRIKGGKYFNPEWWTKKTMWSEDPKKIYFHTNDLKVNYDFGIHKNNKFDQVRYIRYWKKIYDKATKLAIPIDHILSSILFDCS